MNIFITNSLSLSQYNDITELTEECSKADNVHGISFMEQELNEIEEFPCFYLMYDGDRLVSYLSIFIPDEVQCEIYGATHPEMREKDYFDILYSRAIKHLDEYGIENRTFAIESGCNDMINFAKKLGASHVDTDYLMSFDGNTVISSRRILRLVAEKIENTQKYVTYKDETKIGSCKVEFSRTQAVIYNFQVEESMRGKGYGTETLLLVLEDVLRKEADRILLHVNNANQAAHAMYLNHGFVHEEQIEYWQIQ